MYARSIEGQILTFRMHPDLYQENLLIQDLETKSKWSQLAARALEGSLKGSRLEKLSWVQTTWEQWRKLHPNTWVLAPLGEAMPPPFQYLTYYFGQRTLIRGLPEFALVLGLEFGKVQKAYPFSELKKTGGRVEDEVAGSPVQVHFDAESNSAWATDPEGNRLPAVTVYWKHWLSFYPQTEIFVARH